ncbi:MAG: aryl-sulfate sulfotransferase [Deltaproteobacteria bacterium]|nr:aryl-sulfate sulfotransferase [Deltaproteobacteria bacterium]MBW1915173.1 aryl-sulfate sulfotransferase [Deltaproteobacteria bacterium]
MLKNILNTFLVGVFLAVTFSPVYAYEAFKGPTDEGPTELIQYDVSKAYNGYTLFSPFRGKNTYLIDMKGNVVHMWPYPEGWSSPGQEAVEKHALLMEDGSLLRGTIDRSSGRTVTYQLMDWAGKVTWQYKDPRNDHRAHHDFKMIWNPKLKARTLIYVSGRSLTHEEAIARGCDPNLRESYVSSPDGIVEVDMNGNIVWEWNISDHLIQDINPDVKNYVGKGKTIADYPERMNPNFDGGRRGNWIHANSLDYNEALDHIAINNSRNSEFYVIDHGATFIVGDPRASIELTSRRKGDFIFRWGNPCAYESGDCMSQSSNSTGHQQVFFTHDIQWIREKGDSPAKWGLPGAGNFLIFDNGSRRPDQRYSAVLEINPYDGDWKKGKYIPQPEAGHNSRGVSNQIAWSFSPASPDSFFANYISGCQRLPNGNTLIDSGPHGHFFEVTKEGEVVWEYINPVGDRTGDDYGIYEIMNDGAGTRFNSVFRCHRYGPDYPGLAGKDLTPKGPITEIHPHSADEPKSPPPGAGGKGKKGKDGKRDKGKKGGRGRKK